MARLDYDEMGIAKLRYTAIDPATNFFKCTCGKLSCNIASLRPLREHMAELVRVILSAGHEGMIPGQEGVYEAWPSVCYPLQMAASIEDVFADPSITDDSDAWAWCSPAWESEEEDREAASKYVAGLAIFNFVWMAYEGAIRETNLSKFAKDKVAVQARKHFVEMSDVVDDMPMLDFSFRVLKHCCAQEDVLTLKIDEIGSKYKLTGASAAAEIVRLFRNYIVHGSDRIPIYQLSGQWAFARFYAASRLLLLLIQSLVRTQLIDASKSIPLSQTHDRAVEPAGLVFKNLHLRPELWRTGEVADED